MLWDQIASKNTKILQVFQTFLQTLNVFFPQNCLNLIHLQEFDSNPPLKLRFGQISMNEIQAQISKNSLFVTDSFTNFSETPNFSKLPAAKMWIFISRKASISWICPPLRAGIPQMYLFIFPLISRLRVYFGGRPPIFWSFMSTYLPSF